MRTAVRIIVILFFLFVFIGTLVFLYRKSQEKPVVYETESPFIDRKSVV